MPAQHKRPGRTAKEQRRQRAQGSVQVTIIQRPAPASIGPGRVVAIGEWIA